MGCFSLFNTIFFPGLPSGVLAICLPLGVTVLDPDGSSSPSSPPPSPPGGVVFILGCCGGLLKSPDDCSGALLASSGSPGGAAPLEGAGSSGFPPAAIGF